MRSVRPCFGFEILQTKADDDAWVRGDTVWVMPRRTTHTSFVLYKRNS